MSLISCTSNYFATTLDKPSHLDPADDNSKKQSTKFKFHEPQQILNSKKFDQVKSEKSLSQRAKPLSMEEFWTELSKKLVKRGYKPSLTTFEMFIDTLRKGNSSELLNDDSFSVFLELTKKYEISWAVEDNQHLFWKSFFPHPFRPSKL